MSILVDTGVWHAFLNTRDVHHDQARALVEACLSGEHGRVVTTTFVVDEAFTLHLARRLPPERLAALADVLDLAPDRSRGVPEIVGVPPEILGVVVERFARHAERGLSFTDCATLVVMEREHIDTLASFDRGFDGLVERVPRA